MEKEDRKIVEKSTFYDFFLRISPKNSTFAPKLYISSVVNALACGLNFATSCNLITQGIAASTSIFALMGMD